ncbi:trace amine-associated receptor 13c-like [Salarias fasciatus]|uniref:trace amine-associated receptor 13c-like n=1 Tax=Salarias fasciatus TaxID=181472 RepID=UPI001176D877|nr:trace amine-associated receptor 13c-like [Salarias fasciatus]
MEAADLCFPQLLNASCGRPPRPHFETLLIYVLLSCVSLLTVVLNLLVVISISHFRQLQTPTNLLLLSLAVSDFLVGLLMCFQTMLIDGCWYLGDFMCTLYQCLAYVITSASLGTMVVISVDRYVAICCPLQYSSRITQQRVQVCVCLCWICSVLFQCLNLMDSFQQSGRFTSCVGECVFVISQTAALADLVFSFVVPITVILILYLRVFVVAVSQARAMRQQLVPAGPHKSGRATPKKSEMKAARALGTVIVVFLICMCPYYCVSLSGQENALDSSLAAFMVYLFYFNSSLNPIIYAFFYPWFRKSIRLIVTLQILQPDSCDTNML